MTILLASNDRDFSGRLGDFFKSHGHDVDTVEALDAMMQGIEQDRPSLLVLDQFLGGQDMIPQIGTVRRHHAGLFIMVTARHDPIDYVVILETGADDSMVKETPMREMLARLRALQRRAGMATVPARNKIYHLDGWSLAYETRLLSSPRGKVATLTPAERHALSLLMDNVHAVVARERFHDEIMHTPFNGVSRGVDNLISRLRGIVRRLGGELRVESERGAGYILLAIETRGPAAGARRPSPELDAADLDETDPDETGLDETDPDETDLADTDLGDTDLDETDPRDTAFGDTPVGGTGPHTHGPDTTGTDATRPRLAGAVSSERPRREHAGPEHAGPDRSRSDHDRSGHDRSGHDRFDRNGPDCPGPDRNGASRDAPQRNGAGPPDRGPAGPGGMSHRTPVLAQSGGIKIGF